MIQVVEFQKATWMEIVKIEQIPGSEGLAFKKGPMLAFITLRKGVLPCSPSPNPET